MTRRAAFVLLGLSTTPLPACFQGADDTGPVDTADSAGDDTGGCAATVLPAGVYGGVHDQLTVADDGSAELLGDCSLGTVDAVPLDAGAAHWTFTWQSGYGMPVQDTAAVQTIDVAFDGTFCAGRLTGTLTFPDGTTSPVDVTLGAQAQVYGCA